MKVISIENWIFNKKQELATQLGLKVDDISIHRWQGFDWKGSEKSRPPGNWDFLEISKQTPDGQLYAIYVRGKRGDKKVAFTLLILLGLIVLVVYAAFFRN